MATKTPAGFYFVGRPRLEPVMYRTPPQVGTAAAPERYLGGRVIFDKLELVYLVPKGQCWDESAVAIERLTGGARRML